MRTRVDRLRDLGIGIWAGLALLYLFTPIFIVALFSFNDNKGRFNFTWSGFTLRHWQDPFSVEGLGAALEKSLVIGLLATVISLILGTGIALATVRYRYRGRGLVEQMIFLPLATPEVVMGASLLGLFLTVNFARGFITILIAHVMFTMGYVVVTIRARLEGMDLHVEEAAMDLGANEWTTLRKVTLPLIAPGIAAAGLLAYAISIDDFVVTNFNSGVTTTFPLFIYGAARQGVPPEVNVLATALLLIVLVLMVGNVLVQKRLAKRDRGVVTPQGGDAPPVLSAGAPGAPAAG
jgi:spermidine/putrescine transport system permease protein